jgi:hypothetical protein
MTKDDLLAAIAQVEFDTAVAEQAEPGPTMLAPPAHLGHPGQIGHPAG